MLILYSYNAYDMNMFGGLSKKGWLILFLVSDLHEVNMLFLVAIIQIYPCGDVSVLV